MKMNKNHTCIEIRNLERIAVKLLNSNQEWKNKNIPLTAKNRIINNIKEGSALSKDTEKDILTLENYEEKINNNYKKIKMRNENKNNNKQAYYYSVNNNNKDKRNGLGSLKEEEKEKTRKKSQLPKNKKEIVPKIKGLDIVVKNKIDRLNLNSKEESSSSNALRTNSTVIDNTSESISNYINFDILTETNSIYEELKKQFNNLQILNFEENIKNRNDIYFKCKVLAYDYMQFLFGEDIKRIIRLFNYCLEIGEFFIYQIYLFLSIIYIDENKKLDNSIEMSYKTMLLYSSQNFNAILSLIQNPQNSSEPKKMIGIKTKNNIIISVLKLINPNVPTNSQIKEYIYHENNKIRKKKDMNDDIYKIGNFPLRCFEEIGLRDSNKNKSRKKYLLRNEGKYNSLGIINLLLILKNNKELNEKLNQIEKKVLNLYENKNNSNNYTLDNNPNNNNFNQINNITSSLSSFNNNNSKSNIYSSYKNRLSNMNKLLLPNLNMNNNNYKYYLIFELDETLIHYWEEKDNCYVKVRCGVEDCFNKIYDFCEITIVSTSSKEYTDIVVDNINKKKCYIQNRIYKELFDEDDNFDLSLINRDMNKCIFICHEEEFFNAPKQNILQLTEFNGEEYDREIVFLSKELMRIKNNDINDITQIIPEIESNVRT
jgi:hypothetical protein